MKKISLMALLTLVLSGYGLAQGNAGLCPKTPAPLGARYDITETITVPGSAGKRRHREFILWRGNGEVAHEYLDRKITLVWNQTANGGLRALQVFDEPERAIEYEPVHPKEKHKGETWAQYYQLFSPETIANMTLKTESGAGCDHEQVYVQSVNGITRELVWLPARQLARSYKSTDADQVLEWKLLSIMDSPDQVKNAFTVRESYQTTDYADIGDSESDPFLQKMIHLGFINHGGEGFYDSQGHHLGGQPDYHH